MGGLPDGLLFVFHRVGIDGPSVRQGDVFAHSELGLVQLLRALWYGRDEREELKRHRRGGRTVRMALPAEEGPRPLPMPDTTNGLSPRRADH